MTTLLACLAYLALLLTIGLVAHRKHTSASDFILGNRSMNFWVTALSAHASDMSSWLFMGFPMAIYLIGPSQGWIALGLCAGMFCNWHYIAPRLRLETERYQTYTLSTYFERRFKDSSGRIRLVSALMALLYLTHYLSAGLISMGFLFESLFSIEYHVGITVAMAAVMAYCLFGGYVAVAWTDLFQGCFLLAVILTIPVMAFSHTSMDEIATAAQQKGISLSLLPEKSFTGFVSLLLLGLAWGLGYFGSPHILTKFMGIRNPAELKKSKVLGMTWQVLALGAAMVVGLVGLGFFSEDLPNPQLIFVEMVKSLFSPGFGAFVLCAVLAATISTMDSQILVLSAVLTEDFYVEIFRPKASDREQLTVSRLSVAVVCVAALGLAFSGDTTIMDTVTYSWMGLGATFGPPVMMALSGRSVSPNAVVAGILVGGLTSALWHWLGVSLEGVLIPAILPAFGLNLLILFLGGKKSQFT